MENLCEKFKREGIVCFSPKDISIYSYLRLGEYFFGTSNMSSITTINASKNDGPVNPYFSKKELQVHSEGIGISNKNIYGIFVTLEKKPETGGESTFVYTPDIVKRLPRSFYTIKYSFKYGDMDAIEDLIYKHPIEKKLILNFTTLGFDPDTGVSKYIKFLGYSEKENSDMLTLLYDLIEEHKFSMSLEESETVVFDNFLFLHGRAEYSGERIAKRFEVYL